MTEDQIKHMVNRFLCWRLPDSFAPDGGITFQVSSRTILNGGSQFEPTGTNLFTAEQAEAMVKHMLDGLPAGPLTPIPEAAIEAAGDAMSALLIRDEKTTPLLLARVALAAAMPHLVGWRPISEAEKDTWYQVGRIGSPYSIPGILDSRRGIWLSNSGDFLVDDLAPTHFTSIPIPPKPEGGEK